MPPCNAPERPVDVVLVVLTVVRAVDDAVEDDEVVEDMDVRAPGWDATPDDETLVVVLAAPPEELVLPAPPDVRCKPFSAALSRRHTRFHRFFTSLSLRPE